MKSSITQDSTLGFLLRELLWLLRSLLVLVRRKSEGPSSGVLTVIDHRTNRRHRIPIAHNAVQAIHFQAICAGDQSDSFNRFKNGLLLLDPGLQNTAVMKSQITLVDGIKGTIHYRHHSIDDLFGRYGFEDVSHLLIWGCIPTREQKESFRAALVEGMKAPAPVVDAIKALPPDAPSFSMVLAGLAAYAASNPMSIPTAANNPNMYHGNLEATDKALIRTISSMAVLVALTYCHQHNRNFTPPDPNKSFIANVLIMMGFVEESNKSPSPRVVDSLERLWVLYLDHEMTNSTAAFLHVASTLTDPISCCTAYVASGNGPLHAGAVDIAYKILTRLGTPDNVPGLIADVKAKKCRLFGYGHRIYKTVDPRSKYIRDLIAELSDFSKNNPLLAVALEIDRIASKDEYFISRNLKANADLYGSFVYTALGFEPEIIALLMMISRIPGVLAHWREAMSQPPRLWRPRQVYVGPIS